MDNTNHIRTFSEEGRFWIVRMLTVAALFFICAPPNRAENVINEISAEQQRVTVSGKVTDAAGEPLIGAAVLEQGSRSNGVVTDLDGNFTIEVISNAVLVGGAAILTLKKNEN